MSLELRRHRSVMFQAIFSYSALSSQRFRPLLITPACNFLRSTGPLPSQRKACAPLLVSTAESGFNCGRRLEKDLVIFLFLLFPVLQALLDLVFMPRFRG